MTDPSIHIGLLRLTGARETEGEEGGSGGGGRDRDRVRKTAAVYKAGMSSNVI